MTDILAYRSTSQGKSPQSDDPYYRQVPHAAFSHLSSSISPFFSLFFIYFFSVDYPSLSLSLSLSRRIHFHEILFERGFSMKQRRNDRQNKEAATGSFLFFLEFCRMRLEPVSIDFFFSFFLSFEFRLIYMLLIYHFSSCFYIFSFMRSSRVNRDISV